MYQLVIGNRNYSSWSLRAWLFLKQSKVDFQEVYIPLYTDNYKERLLSYSPSGKVPALVDTDTLPLDSVNVWDSMSIMEYVLEREQEHSTVGSLVGWPEDLAARAYAKSISFEMHSDFMNLRGGLPQNLRKRTVVAFDQLSEGCKADIARVDEIWQTCLNKFRTEEDTPDGPSWLFGSRMTIADIMFVPVALRFVTYGIEVSPVSQAFMKAVQGNEFVQEWIELSNKEDHSLSVYDNIFPIAGESPLI
jgi:glutathione S-transferase